ncbi:hypothetical protein BC781_1139 [Sediminitomix flava]|uniref:SUKH superfamily protein n=2 Tax=Sediminitomix flava TaxID=379075 RepID=A0A315YV57_SEDFL|nr:hypothetical protein BC781_1139 [Sediminitomix flava]
MTDQELNRLFKNHKIPSDYIKLRNFEFSLDSQSDYYSNGFELLFDENDFMLKTYSTDNSFLDSFIIFAQADGTGSLYAYWLNNGELTQDTPIVIFGSEEGVYAIADNFKDLLKILTFDSEPMVYYDEISYYKNLADYNVSKNRSEYIKWLKSEFKIDPIESTEELVLIAQQKYQKDLEAWINKFTEI